MTLPKAERTEKTMLLFIIRHAQAEPALRPGQAGDAARPLSDKGRDQASTLGRLFKALGTLPEVIWTSPLVRARETAEGLGQELTSMPIEEINALGAPGDFSELRRQLRETNHQCLALVGHQPFLGECVQYWLCGQAHPGLHLSKASLTALSGNGYGREDMRLEYMVNHSLATLLTKSD